MDKEIDKSGLRYRLSENTAMLREIYKLIVVHKTWWLLPIFFVLAFMSTFLVVAGGHSILPAIYALF
jgi:hypothetical protein